MLVVLAAVVVAVAGRTGDSGALVGGLDGVAGWDRDRRVVGVAGCGFAVGRVAFVGLVFGGFEGEVGVVDALVSGSGGLVLFPWFCASVYSFGLEGGARALMCVEGDGGVGELGGRGSRAVVLVFGCELVAVV